MTTTPHGQVPAIQRYKIGYHSDEWGVRSLSPTGIYDDAGPWVRYEDHATVITALRAYCQELESQVIRDCMTHVQNPAEIERAAGDVSKNGAESNMSTQQPAPATQQPEGDVVAYLDVGANGYLDLGSELSEDALQQLPKGRHALVIAGTYGIDGYVAAPQPSPTTQADSAKEAPNAMQSLTDALKGDPEYAWAWHCNLAMPIMDNAKVSHRVANITAAHLMQHLFGIDTEKHPHFEVADEAPQADSQPAQVRDERDDFEKVFPLPSGCIRVGTGYASTGYSNWAAHTHCERWQGWQARAARAQADSGVVPVDVPVNRIPLLNERDQECALVRTARGWEFHRNGDLIRELNIYERLFVDSALAAHTPPTSL